MPGFDILGNIAIVDFERVPKERRQSIAKRILNEHKNVETILAKAGPVKGKFRTRKLKYILGKRNYIADYKENNCRFIFDARKSFFSNRLSFERNRIASMPKEKENIVVMFAGVGPFAIEMAKMDPKANIVAIELNKDAYLAMRKNVEINKVNNVTPILGDAKRMAAKYRNFADRVVMPHPTASLDFLDSALKVAKKNAMLHIYIFTERDSFESRIKSLLKAHAESHRYKASITGIKVVREYSASQVEICADVRITK